MPMLTALVATAARVVAPNTASPYLARCQTTTTTVWQKLQQLAAAPTAAAAAGRQHLSSLHGRTLAAAAAEATSSVTAWSCHHHLWMLQCAASSIGISSMRSISGGSNSMRCSAVATAAAYSSAAGDEKPGQAFLASLVDYEKLGVPKAAGVAPAAGNASTTSTTSTSGAAEPVQPVTATAGSGPEATAAVSAAAAAAGGFDLAVMHRLLSAFGDPQKQVSVVHIAGTKGKGSVAVLLSAILRAAGYRVGTYTSPHLFHIRERIVVGGRGMSSHLTAAGTAAGSDGGHVSSSNSSHAPAAPAAGVPAAVPISEEQWEALAVQAQQAVVSLQQQQPSAGSTAAANTSSSMQLPSHFEVVTAMAMRHFVNEAVDIAVIETGLGGARDATNVFGPQQLQAAVLTAVGLDHLAALGGSLESIAAAKAGIMKPGVPVVVGPQTGAVAHTTTSSSSSSSSSSSDSGDNVQHAAADTVVLQVFQQAANRPDMMCPLMMADQLVQASVPPTAASIGSGTAAPAISIQVGPGSHLARQALSISASFDPSLIAAISPTPGSMSLQHQHAPATTGVPADNSDTETRREEGSGVSGPERPPARCLQLKLPDVSLQLVGQHQIGNVQTAVAAALLLTARGWQGLTEGAVREGLEAAWLPGRFQVIQLEGSPTHFVLDGAHTADSAAALASTLRAAFPKEPVVLVVAMAADKEHREVLQALRAIKPQVVVFTSVPIAGSHARSAPPGTLAAHWQAGAILSTGRPFRCRELIQANLGAALDKARHELGAHGGKGIVVVTGSLHAVAAAMKHLQQ